MSQITRANKKIFKEIVGGLAKKNRDSLFGELLVASAGNLISFCRSSNLNYVSAEPFWDDKPI